MYIHHYTLYIFLVYLAGPKDNKANFAGLTARSAGKTTAPRDFGGKHSEALFTALVAGLATYAMLLGPARTRCFLGGLLRQIGDFSGTKWGI